MSSALEQKNRYESAGIRALHEGDHKTAFANLAKASECAIHLAERTDGIVSQAHLADARDLIELARRAQQKGQDRKKPVVVSSVSPQESQEAVPSKASQWILTDKPTVRLTDVAGLEDVKRVIQEDVFNPMKYGEAYRQCKIPPGGGALMYGPPGNGKTFIAKAIAGELDAVFFSVSGAQIKDKYVGETEKNMRLLFEEAAKHDRVVIFIDEIHSILGRRGNEKVNVIDEFLVLADGITERKNNLLILGATNYPWLMDDAVFRRLGRLIYVGMPDRAARRKIFELQFDGVPVEQDFSLDEFADRSERFSGADVKQISSTAKKRAIARMIDSAADSPVVLKDDVFTVMQAMTPTVRPELIEKYRAWRETLTGGGEFSDSGNED